MVATAERVGKVARIGGEGGWVIRAIPELKRFYSFDGFPNTYFRKSSLRNAKLAYLGQRMDVHFFSDLHTLKCNSAEVPS